MPYSRPFISNMCLLISISLLGNGLYSLSSPFADFFFCWCLIVDSFVLLLALIPDPPILAIFFELAAMARLPSYISEYNKDPKRWKGAAVSVAMWNTSIVIHCYFLYYLGTGYVGRRSSRILASAQLKFPKLLTGMNAFMEVIILFSCNNAVMILVSMLQFQESYVAVICGLTMIILSGICLIPIKVSKVIIKMGRRAITMMGRLREAMMAHRATGVAASTEERTVGLEQIAEEVVAADQMV